MLVRKEEGERSRPALVLSKICDGMFRTVGSKREATGGREGRWRDEACSVYVPHDVLVHLRWRPCILQVSSVEASRPQWLSSAVYGPPLNCSDGSVEAVVLVNYCAGTQLGHAETGNCRCPKTCPNATASTE